MKVLVTGAAGFIGSHAALSLSKLGHQVVGVDFFSSFYNIQLKELNVEDLEQRAITIIRTDLSNKGFFNLLPTDFDYIIHFAAQCGLAPIIHFDDYMKNNIQATENLLQFAILNKHLRMFIYISSSSVYGAKAIADEFSVPEPISNYGITKLAAEQLVLSYFRSGTLSTCALRLYSVYGPGERPDKLYTKLICAALSDKSFTLYEGSEKHIRSFTYIDDIIEGIILVMNNSETCDGEIINLGNELTYTTEYGIACIETLLGKKLNIKILPPRTGDQVHTSAVIDKAKLKLNYTPKVSLPDGLQKQIIWCHKNIDILHNANID